jgi:hypothetical protein
MKTNMLMHFEELWEKSEQYHNQNSSEDSPEEILNEVVLKINLLKAIEVKTDLPKEETEQAKSRLLGEILFSLTNLSLKDNINVFEALKTALLGHSIGHYSNKYSD